MGQNRPPVGVLLDAQGKPISSGSPILPQHEPPGWLQPVAILIPPLILVALAWFFPLAPLYMEYAVLLLLFSSQAVVCWVAFSFTPRRYVVVGLVLVFLFVLLIAAARSDSQRGSTIFSLDCANDARLAENITDEGRPLPHTVVFVSPDSAVTETLGPVLPQDQNGYFYQIRTFFKRCNLHNAGPAEATNVSLTITSWSWNPIRGQFLSAPFSTTVVVPNLEIGKPFEFGITNHGLLFSKQEVSASISYRSIDADRTGNMEMSEATKSVISSTLTDQPIQKTPFRHFSKCHFRGVLIFKNSNKATFNGVPPECSPAALKREHDSWQKGAW